MSGCPPYSDPVCDTVKCGSLADFECYWPGQTCKKCLYCTQHLGGIAEAMGFDLQYVLLPQAMLRYQEMGKVLKEQMEEHSERHSKPDTSAEELGDEGGSSA